jgi:hypothetical protein
MELPWSKAPKGDAPVGITTIVAATALTMGAFAGSGGVGTAASTPAVSATTGVTTSAVSQLAKHDSDACGHKKGKHAGWCTGTYLPSPGTGYVWGAPGQSLTPTTGGYVSAPPGQAVSPIGGGYASTPPGQALSPVVGGGYVSTPPGEAIAPVG